MTDLRWGIVAAGLVTSCAAVRERVVFEGACDASGAVALDARRFAMADDEDNVLRIYDADRGGPPLWTFDLARELGPERHGDQELDLEAATRIGDRAVWLASHARTKHGDRAPSRLLCFLTEIPGEGGPLKLVGQAYPALIGALMRDPRLRPYDLEAAAERPPQAPGGLNIEGMTATPDGHLWLGFRNPIPGGRALLVQILNPLALSLDVPPVLGDVVTLDLDGRGVRGLSWWRGELLILAGSYAYDRSTKLFAWDDRARSAPREVAVDLEGLNPEAFFTPEERDEVLIVSDDGHQEIAGRRCKHLASAELKRFRGTWVRVPRGDRPAVDTVR